MRDDASRQALYVITAQAEEGFIQQTRQVAANALVLAQRWLASGYAEVRITDTLGRPSDVETFRANRLNGRRL
jgi:hypothetical protein